MKLPSCWRGLPVAASRPLGLKAPVQAADAARDADLREFTEGGLRTGLVGYGHWLRK